MTISFSGLASGMDTSSWVEALVSVKQSEITKLESSKSTVTEAQSILNNIKSYFTSFENLLLNITDSNKFSNSSRDLFTSNLAESSNVSVLTATANNYAERTTYNIDVSQLATATEVSSGIDITVPTSTSDTATLQSKLYDLAYKDENDVIHDVHAGTVTFSIDGNERSVTINSETTIEDFIDMLDSIGVSSAYDERDGIFSLGVSVQKQNSSKALSTADGVATASTKLIDLGIISDYCDFSIQIGDNLINVNSLDENSTLQDFFDVLQDLGVTASIDSNGVIALSNGSIRGDLASMLSFTESTRYIKSDTSGVIDVLGLEDVNYGYTSDLIQIITTTTISGTATEDSLLKDLFIPADKCGFRIVDNDGNVEEFNDEFTPESTLGEVMDLLAEHGILASFNKDGSLTITSDKFGSVFTGDLADALGFHEIEEPYVSLNKMTSTAIVYSTVETVVNRDSTLKQIGAVTNNGVDTLIIRECDGGKAIATISTLTTSSTVQDFFNAIAAHGITGTITDGVITLNSTSGNFIDGNIATNIGILQPVIETYYTTAPITMTSQAINTSTIPGSPSLAQATLGALGMTSDGSVIIDSPVYGIVSVNINKELTVQGFCDKINDSNYGIHAQVSGNKIEISELDGSGAFVKSMSPILQTALRMGVGEDLSYNSTTINVYTNTDSGYIKYDDTGVEINANTVISSLGNYHHGNGQLLLHRTTTISSDPTITMDDLATIIVDQTLTLEEFINNPIVGLAQYGITGQVLSDGKAYIKADSDFWLEEIDGGSEILSALNFAPFDPDVNRTWSGRHIKGIESLQYTLTVTSTVSATKDTALNTWDRYTWNEDNTALLPDKIAEGSLVFKVNGYYKTVDIGSKDTFNTLISKMDEIGIKASLTRGVFYIESAYDDIVFMKNESSSSLADLIHLNENSQNLGNYSASSRPVISTVTTDVQERISAASYADMDTQLSTLGITEGKLTIYRNGRKAEIFIEEGDDFNHLQTELASKFGDLRISFTDPYDPEATDDGYLRIYSTDRTANISIGSTSDSTNFTTVTGVSSLKDYELQSSRQLYKLNDRTELGTSGIFRNGEVTSGSFKVGAADIYVQEDENGNITTTMADIVSQINSSENSLATAYWDNIDGKLVIKSTLTGASAVNIEAGDTNLTDLLGLTDGENLIMNSQKIGQNAIFSINGATYTSLSNNVTSETTGLTGLTINLKGMTSGSSVQLTVKRDTETLKNNIQNVVDAYNELIENVDSVISKTGKLKNQSLLKLIKNDIRTKMMSSYGGLTTSYQNLASVGIKSANASAGNIATSDSAISLLTLDVDEFVKAFEADDEGMRLLLIGDGSETNKGIFGQIHDDLFNELSTTGYFESANKAYNTQKENYTKKIANGTAAIEKYRAKLEKKFSAMDIMIANMQNQFKSFLS